MLHWRKNYKTFLIVSLLIHVVLAEILHQFYHPEDHFHSVFSHTISARLQVNSVVKAPQVKHIPQRTLPMPAKKETPVVPQENAQTKPTEDVAATEATEGAPESAAIETAKNKYFRQVTQAIYRKKHYPRQAYSLNQEGMVIVRLKLDKKGKILDLEVLEKAPFRSLTEASLETIKSISRFPPIPEELGMSEITFRIPIEYKINL